MFKKLNHIGIVVKDFKEAMKIYSKVFGMEVFQLIEIPDVSLKIGVFKLGDVEIELLHYQNPDLPIVKALNGDRLGINHLCYEVDSFERTMERLIEAGFTLIDGFPRKGVHGRIAFFIPPYSSEERIEILEVERENDELLERT